MNRNLSTPHVDPPQSQMASSHNGLRARSLLLEMSVNGFKRLMGACGWSHLTKKIATGQSYSLRRILITASRLRVTYKVVKYFDTLHYPKLQKVNVIRFYRIVGGLC